MADVTVTEAARQADAEDRAMDAKLSAFREALGWSQSAPADPHPRSAAIKFLSSGVEAHYWKASTFAEAIQHVLYEPEASEDLNHADRQRCLISILATRAEMFPLAIHTYIGLLEGIGVREMRNIFFLVGVYSGVPGMINGIDVLGEVLRIFQSEWAGMDAAKVHGAILTRLKAQFSVGAFRLQLVMSVAKDMPDAEFNQLFGTVRERAQKTGIWFGEPDPA
jgi:hypothetical protein